MTGKATPRRSTRKLSEKEREDQHQATIRKLRNQAPSGVRWYDENGNVVD